MSGKSTKKSNPSSSKQPAGAHQSRYVPQIAACSNRNSRQSSERTETPPAGTKQASLSTFASSRKNDADLDSLPRNTRTITSDTQLTIRRKQKDAGRRRRERRISEGKEIKERVMRNEEEIIRLEDSVSILETRLERIRRAKGKIKDVVKSHGEFFEEQSYFGDAF